MPRCIHAMKRRAVRESIKDSPGYLFGQQQSRLASLQGLGMLGGARNNADLANAFIPFDGSLLSPQGTLRVIPEARPGMIPAPTWATKGRASLRSFLQRTARLLRAVGGTQ